jgi:hypothetical protein
LLSKWINVNGQCVFLQQSALTLADVPKQRRRPQPTQDEGKCRTEFEWACWHGNECIAKYDVCTGIAQCADKSDEDGEFCRQQLANRRRQPIRQRTPDVAQTTSLQRVQQSASEDYVDGDVSEQAARGMKPTVALAPAVAGEWEWRKQQ